MEGKLLLWHDHARQTSGQIKPIAPSAKRSSLMRSAAVAPVPTECAEFSRVFQVIRARRGAISATPICLISSALRRKYGRAIINNSKQDHSHLEPTKPSM
jgi:anthranilate/para-aminobenzoate synthase component II